MARYLGPKCKLARQEGTDLFLNSARRSSTPSASWIPSPVNTGAKSGMRQSDFGNQLREKQKLRRMCGCSSVSFAVTSSEAARRKGVDRRACCSSSSRAWTTSSIAWASVVHARRGARQLVGHCAIMVQRHSLNVPSATLTAGDVVASRPRPRPSCASSTRCRSSPRRSASRRGTKSTPRR